MPETVEETMIDIHAALIETMFLVSAADAEMSDAELGIIGEIVTYLPIFRDYDRESLSETLQECAQLLSGTDGLQRGLASIKVALPPKLRETAYALACDVAAADGKVSEEEMRILEMLRDELEIDRLVASAIERAAQARFRTH